ncbi:MAG: hypothetical protein QCI38_00830 [Candidatus Thermoplasmatota archaeon]|nr:hypothetical protein [Candidatus Thermoplasmatota archaeon]
MKILHVRDIANVATNMAKYQRLLGHDARLFDFIKKEGMDYCLGLETQIIPEYKKLEGEKRGIMEELRFGAKLVRYGMQNKLHDFDVFHFHGGRGFLPHSEDIPLIKIFSDKMVMHYHGSTLKARGRYYLNGLCNVELVSTPDLLERVPWATWVPNIISQTPEKKKNENAGFVRIGHAPTNRVLKGTKDIITAVEKLKKKLAKPLIEFDLIESVSHEEALRRYSACDIMIDRVSTGNPLQGAWPGVVAFECAKMGIPVCTHIDSSLETRYLPKNHGFSIVTVDNLESILEQLIIDKELRNKLGFAGQKTTYKVYDNRENVKRILRLYR